MKVFSISMVRNEADIIRTNVLHHLSLGLDRMLIVDNGSSDGTDRILHELSRDPRVHWTRDTGPYRQFEVFTTLAREAFRAGADWIMPVDADEFWCTTGRDLWTELAETSAVAIRVRVVNFIQRRDQLQGSPQGLLHMTRRVAEPAKNSKWSRKLVMAQKLAFVERAFTPKWIVRTSESIAFAEGAHEYSGVEGPREKTTGGVVCLHAPLRSRSALEAKAANRHRFVEARSTEDGGVIRGARHWARWLALAEGGRLDVEWAANSYVDDGWIDVYGERRQAIFDPRLRDVVAPWIAQTI